MFRTDARPPVLSWRWQSALPLCVGVGALLLSTSAGPASVVPGGLAAALAFGVAWLARPNRALSRSGRSTCLPYDARHAPLPGTARLLARAGRREAGRIVLEIEEVAQRVAGASSSVDAASRATLERLEIVNRESAAIETGINHAASEAEALADCVSQLSHHVMEATATAAEASREAGHVRQVLAAREANLEALAEAGQCVRDELRRLLLHAGNGIGAERDDIASIAARADTALLAMMADIKLLRDDAEARAVQLHALAAQTQRLAEAAPEIGADVALQAQAVGRLAETLAFARQAAGRLRGSTADLSETGLRLRKGLRDVGVPAALLPKHARAMATILRGVNDVLRHEA